MRRINWSDLVRKIETNRSQSAQFFKPTCVISAIDLADEGVIKADDIDIKKVADRFSDYVTPFFKKRGTQGFKPLWHLQNDGLWALPLDANGQKLNHSNIAAPHSTKHLLRISETCRISEGYRELWGIAKERRALRDSMLLILYDSDADSRKLVGPLFNSKYLLNPDRWPNNEILEAYFELVRDQLHLFKTLDGSSAKFQVTETENESKISIIDEKEKDSSIENAPNAFDNVPAAVNYVWSGSTIIAAPSLANIPVYPNESAKHLHDQRMEACRSEATFLVQDLASDRWQVRRDFSIELDRYMSRLPFKDQIGNIILADTSIRTLREMFRSDATIIPAPFAARLKSLIQLHIALRPFYPEISQFYDAVKNGRIGEPVPSDAIGEVLAAIHNHTPQIFDESVEDSIAEVVIPKTKEVPAEIDETSNDVVLPPTDPLGEPDPERARNVQIWGVLKRFWKVFQMGDAIQKSSSAWISAYHSLAEPINRILSSIKSIF